MIPLRDIEEIIAAHLDTTAFDPTEGFQQLQGYDPARQAYVTEMIGGYGGAAALGVLRYEETEHRVRMVLGSYEMDGFYADPPRYRLEAQYETEFWMDDGLSNWKLLNAGFRKEGRP